MQALQSLLPASSLEISVPVQAPSIFFGHQLLKFSNDPPSSQPHLDDGAPLNVFVFEPHALILS